MEAKSQWRQPLITDPIALHVHFYFQTKRRRDLDNQNKLILDALTGVVYGTTARSTSCTLYRHYDKENPRIEVDLAILNSLMKAQECSEGNEHPDLRGSSRGSLDLKSPRSLFGLI